MGKYTKHSGKFHLKQCQFLCPLNIFASVEYITVQLWNLKWQHLKTTMSESGYSFVTLESIIKIEPEEFEVVLDSSSHSIDEVLRSNAGM